jgi:hypothetical protein
MMDTTSPAGQVLVEFNGTIMTMAELPDTGLRATCDYGHFPARNRVPVHVPGRSWPWSPSTCSPDDYPTEWINSEILVCTGCGLDCT